MTPTKRLRLRTGFTVAELMVSLVVLAAVVGASTATLLKVQKQYNTQRTVTETRETLRAVEMVVQRAFRNARVNPRNASAATVGMVVDPLGRAATNGGIFNMVDIRGDFNPIDGLAKGDWEDVRVELTQDTVYVRYKQNVDKEAVAYPVSQLRFQFYNLAGTELTTAGTAAGARSVKVTMAAPVPKTSTTLKRELWIFLRN
jgi:hypothetical protein